MVKTGGGFDRPTLKKRVGCFVRGGRNGMGCFVWGSKNGMGCFVQGGISMQDVLSWVSKNGMGRFVLGCYVLHSLSRHAAVSVIDKT